MTVRRDPLALVEAAIAALGDGPEVEVWTALDGAEDRVSNAKSLTDKGFGRIGRIGRRQDRGTEEFPVAGTAGTGGGDARGSRALYPIQNTVQSVQSVQEGEKAKEDQGVGFGRSAAVGVQNRGSTVQKPAADLPVRLEAGATPAPEAAIAALRGRPAFEARAALLESKGGLPRARAERLALEGVVADWLINHPPAGLDTDRCAACGAVITVAASDWRPLADGAVVHYGGGRGLGCWHRWQVMRRGEALAALRRAAQQDGGDGVGG